jgi:hypothetical protein
VTVLWRSIMKADIVLIKNDHSPVLLPTLNTYGHVALQVSAHASIASSSRRARPQAHRWRADKG